MTSQLQAVIGLIVTGYEILTLTAIHALAGVVLPIAKRYELPEFLIAVRTKMVTKSPCSKMVKQ